MRHFHVYLSPGLVPIRRQPSGLVTETTVPRCTNMCGMSCCPRCGSYTWMRTVEELVRRKLEKRAPDDLSPKPEPYELRAPRGCSLLLPTAIANGVRKGHV